MVSPAGNESQLILPSSHFFPCRLTYPPDITEGATRCSFLGWMEGGFSWGQNNVPVKSKCRVPRNVFLYLF